MLPGTQPRNRYGPVPTIPNPAFMSVVDRPAASRAETTWISPNCSINRGTGPSVLTTNPCAPSAVTDSTPRPARSNGAGLLGIVLARARENTTSSAVNGDPS